MDCPEVRFERIIKRHMLSDKLERNYDVFAILGKIWFFLVRNRFGDFNILLQEHLAFGWN